MSEPLLTRDLQDLENALKQLAPAGGLERDQLMYRAGRASAPRHGWLWPAAAAGMTAVAIALGGLLMLRPSPAPSEKIVYVTVREQPPPPAPEHVEPPRPLPPPTVQDGLPRHATTEYQQMKQLALRWGVENLPTSTALASAHESPQSPRLTSAMTKSLPDGRLP